MKIKTKEILVGIVIVLLIGIGYQYSYYQDQMNNIRPTIIEKEKLVVSTEKIYITVTPLPPNQNSGKEYVYPAYFESE